MSRRANFAKGHKESAQPDLRQQHNDLYRKHPDLSWDSYEENASDLGHEVDTDAWHREVLSQAREEIANR